MRGTVRRRSYDITTQLTGSGVKEPYRTLIRHVCGDPIASVVAGFLSSAFYKLSLIIFGLRCLRNGPCRLLGSWLCTE